MSRVKVAELKAKLSGYLRQVKQGETVTVYDRSTPIADIVPHESSGLSIIESTQELKPLLRKLSKRKRVTKNVFSLSLLKEDRKR